VAGFAVGEKIEVQLNDNTTALGARGTVSDSGFMLVDSHNRERQIAFTAIVAGVVALLVVVVAVGHQVSGGHGG
jgi:hypothetical protein